MRLVSIGSALALILPAASAQEFVIVNYTMTANVAAINGTLNVNPTTTLANVTATQLKNQAGVATIGSFAYTVTRIVSAVGQSPSTPPAPPLRARWRLEII